MKPFQLNGLWLAVIIIPMARRCCTTARLRAGVGIGEPEIATSLIPASANTFATSYANCSDAKRVSKPTTAPWSTRPSVARCAATALAHALTLSNVNSSAITARQPSVPKLMLGVLVMPRLRAALPHRSFPTAGSGQIVRNVRTRRHHGKSGGAGPVRQ